MYLYLQSGRLYVRNLAYICAEENLEELFGKYGPLSEVHLPIDRYTKKIKGFAFITYMIPEHAVKAHAELDGSNFLVNKHIFHLYFFISEYLKLRISRYNHGSPSINTYYRTEKLLEL